MASASLSEEQSQEQQQQTVKEKESVYKTKIVQFLGRTTPIILQNDNGPCPLLAICNILLLRNNLNLAPDTTEVSQEKLLSLVAERLIDSNSNVNNKDAGYVENQEQNISDAIDLLPRLATGIDVNIKFRSVADFEFTPECAIFDLLDIPLYHGWIVDPQDHDTASAIGSKSYNALTGELVALETQNPQSESKTNPEEDCIDFAAATTATLGVPSPCLSKNRSFDDSPMSHSDEQKVGKGDLQEEAELLKALKLSETESPTSDGNPCLPNVEQGSTLINLDESTSSEKDDFLVKNVSHQDDTIHQLDLSTPDVRKTSDNGNTDISALETNSGKLGSGKFGSSFSNADLPLDQSLMKTEEHDLYHRVVEKSSGDSLVGTTPHMEWSSVNANFIDTSQGVDKIQNSAALTMNDHEPETKNNGDITIESSLSSLNVDSDTSNRRIDHTDGTEALSPSVDVSEPIYEGEECILDAETKTFADREPVYEGEVVLAEQADRSTSDSDNGNAKDEITPKQGELIRNFLKNNASQLTIYGLFCLQEGLKERELCVFFRNNHFSTMFKFDGQLYLLATDQGYINQPDLVWEKLNEVNGDSSFMTGNFKEFKVESQANDTWDQHNAMTSTADYLASIDSATQAGFDMNSDLQLAIALQQQEFEQQSSPRHNVQQQSLSSTSGLITGPHVPKNSGRNPSSSSSSSSARAEAAKQKEKCSLM